MLSDAIKSLETEPVGRLLVKYALPAIAGMVVFSLYNVVDSIFIGQWVGEYALAGLAVAFPVMNLSAALGSLLGVGGAALCSIRLGEKNIAGAERAFGNVVTLGVIFGVVFGGGSALFLEPILTAFGASEQTMPYAYQFMLVTQLSAPVTYAFLNLTHIMRSTGYPNRALAALCLSVCVNVVLAPIFIKVLGLGITGAALATLCAQLSGLFFVVQHFCSKKSTVHFERGIYRPRAETVLPIISIGIAPSLLNACGCAVAVVINRQLLAFGGDLAVGAYGIFARVMILLAMVVVGLTQGAQPVVGFNHGAGHYNRVRRTFMLTFLVGSAISTTGFLVCEIFPRQIALAFTDNEQLIAFSVQALRIGAAAFAFVGGQIVVNNFFQSIGRGKTAAVLSTTRQLIFLVPGVLALPHFFGQNGVWWSLPLADILSVVLTAVVFIRFLRDYRPPQVVIRSPLPENNCGNA